MQGPKTDLKLQNWKEKAKTRRLQISGLIKRLAELKRSRDKWKSKYKVLKSANLSKVCVQEKKIVKPVVTKVKHHSYSAELIQLSIQLRSIAGCSYRSCVKIIYLLSLWLDQEFTCPSPSTIRNWEIKMGLSQLSEQRSTTNQWVLIMDESVNLGGLKMLLLLGVNLEEYKFDKPLTLDKVQVLYVGLGKSWKGSSISEAIKSVENQGYQFKYACTDNGNNLGKSLRISKISQVKDCTHSLGKLLEKAYKKKPIFKAFSQRATLFKRQIMLSKHAEYMPPKQRSKGRFLNLASISNWSKKLLELAKCYQKQLKESQESLVELEEIFEKIAWILDYQDFIVELENKHLLLKPIWAILKQEGYSQKSKQTCLQLIETSKASTELKQGIKAYFEQIDQLSIEDEKIVCCSDIIESIFGKFKNKVSSNSEIGITENAVTVANYGRNIETQQVKDAMEKVKIVDIQKWRNENVPISIFQKKKKLFKKWG